MKGDESMRNRWSRAVLLIALVAAVFVGGSALFIETEARGRCICPKVYAPVECDNGKTYPNQCVADCRHAKNCVPVGIEL
jgi:hypothetical protein